MLQSRQFGSRPGSAAHLSPDSESGFLLLFVLFLAALMLIALAMAAPRIATSIQRDKEIELVHRGEQYKRAIKLYYRKFGTYPSSIDQLLNTNNIRFLRKRYTDPITGKDDWRIIHLGQAKVPPMGFFGQPLTGLPGATNVGTPIGSPVGATPGSIPGTTPGTIPSSPFGSATLDAPDENSPSDDSSSSTAFGESATSNPSTTITGAPPGAAASTTSPTSPTSSTSPSPFSSSSGPGSALGGGPIVGVGIPSPKASLIAYKKQKHYNQWEFVYNPIEDQMQAAAAALNGGGIQSTDGANSSTGSSTSNSPFSSNGSSFGNNNSGSSFGNNNGSGSNFGGATTTPPDSNQQQPQ